MSDAPAVPLPADPLVLRYLEHVRVEKRLAARTVTLYTLDLEKLALLAAGVNMPLLQLGVRFYNPATGVFTQRSAVRFFFPGFIR